MKVIEIDALNKQSNPHGVDVRKVYDNECVDMMFITLNPGESIPKHQMQLNALFFVIEGSGVIELGDESQEVTKETMIVSPANIPRGWTNNSNRILKILVIKMI